MKWYKNYLKNYDFRYGRLRTNKKNIPLKARASTTTKLFRPAEYRKRTQKFLFISSFMITCNFESSGLLDVNLDIDLTPTKIEQINSNFEDNFDVEIHISETSKKIIENLQQKSVPIQDLNVTSDMTSCINNLTIVPEKSVDLPAALNSGKNNG